MREQTQGWSMTVPGFLSEQKRGWVVFSLGRAPHAKKCFAWAVANQHFSVSKALKITEYVCSRFDKWALQTWDVRGASEWLEIEVLNTVLRITLLARDYKEPDVILATDKIKSLIAEALSKNNESWEEVPYSITKKIAPLNMPDLIETLPNMAWCVIENIELTLLLMDQKIEDRKKMRKRIRI